MKVHAVASMAHYARHLNPIIASLPTEVRGHCRRRPLEGAEPGLTLVASYGDLVACANAGQPVVYVEHGAGQTYEGDPQAAGHSYYAGGVTGFHRRAVKLYVCPSERVAALWRRSHHDATTAVVGCPALDIPLRMPPRRMGTNLVVSFHWDALGVCSEARSACPYYEDALAGLRRALEHVGWSVWGHLHPKATPYESVFHAAGISIVSLEKALSTADVWAVDNSSVGFEAAALGIPVIWLNCPLYRREMDHGLRFWDAVAGQPQCDDPTDLAELVLSVANDDLAVPRAWRMAESVYRGRNGPLLDGRASERAVAAIGEVLRGV